MFFNNRFGGQLSPYYSSLPKRTGINWANLLNNTQKTLGIINQAIPICYQIGPIYRNAKTMFRVASEINKDNKNESSNYSNPINTQSNEYNSSNTTNNDNNYSDNGPNFFI